MTGRPVAVATAITSAVHAVILCVVALGVAHWSGAQVATIDVAAQAVIAVPLALLVQSKVTPTAKS